MWTSQWYLDNNIDHNFELFRKFMFIISEAFYLIFQNFLKLRNKDSLSFLFRNVTQYDQNSKIDNKFREKIVKLKEEIKENMRI